MQESIGTMSNPALIVLHYMVSIHLYSACFSVHQAEALPVRETERIH